jgi:mannose-6-phosphate isomerase-like protein (cupin superfamily)
MTNFRIAKLAQLVNGWKETSQVKALIEQVDDRAMMGKVPFAGSPLPESLTAGRLPPGIRSAWVFVQRPKASPPPHKHPNSVQHMAVIAGTGMCRIGRRASVIQPFDPAYPDQSIYVIPENTPHSLESFNEPLVILSFHTALAEDLEEVDADTGDRRKYI